MIGCEECMNKLYKLPEGLLVKCPVCRHSRGLANTFILKGFDTLVTETQKLVDDTDNESEEDDDIALPRPFRII